MLQTSTQEREIEAGSLEELLGSLLSLKAIRIEPELGSLSRQHWQYLTETATTMGIGGLLYSRLFNRFREQTPDWVLAQLRAFHHRNVARNLRLGLQFQELLREFSQSGIAVIPLKGACLASLIYPHSGLRYMSDIDLLLHPGALSDAVEMMHRLGYRPIHPFAVETVAAGGAQHLPPFVREREIPVELHWTLLSPLGSRLKLDSAGLWERSRQATIFGMEVRILSPEDLLLHLCVHFSNHLAIAQGSLRPLCDIAVTIDHYRDELNWDVTVARALAWGCPRAVYLPLQLTRRLLKQDFPEDILGRLGPQEYPREIIESACKQIFEITQDQSESATEANLGHVVSASLARGSILKFLKRLFPPAMVIRQRYGLRPDQSALPYYPLRFFDVARRYLPTAFRVFGRRGQGAFDKGMRANHLSDWLGLRSFDFKGGDRDGEI